MFIVSRPLGHRSSNRVSYFVQASASRTNHNTSEGPVVTAGLGKTVRILALGALLTVFYACFGILAIWRDLEPRWFFIPAGLLCFAAIPLSYIELHKWWRKWN